MYTTLFRTIFRRAYIRGDLSAHTYTGPQTAGSRDAVRLLLIRPVHRRIYQCHNLAVQTRSTRTPVQPPTDKTANMLGESVSSHVWLFGQPRLRLQL